MNKNVNQMQGNRILQKDFLDNVAHSREGILYVYQRLFYKNMENCKASFICVFIGKFKSKNLRKSSVTFAFTLKQGKKIDS